MTTISTQDTELVPPAGAAETGNNSFGALLRLRNFWLLWVGEGISLIGDQFYMIALPWLVLQLTGDPLAMGGVLALAGIPRAAFMLVGGAISDRFQARNVMFASNIARMALVGILAATVFTGTMQLWMLYVLALLFGLADAFFFPAQSAIVPQIVKREQLHTANAIIQGTAQFSLFVGPVLAGVLIALFGSSQVINGESVPDMSGIALAFAIDALTFLASAITLVMIRDMRPIEQNGEESVLRSIRDGLAYVWNDKLLRYYFIMIAAANVFISGPMAIGIPVLADTRLPQGAAAFGIIMSAFGGGALLGIILAGAIPQPPRRWLGSVLFVIWAGMGIMVATLAVVGNTWVAAISAALMGLSNGYVTIIFITWLQQRTPDAMLGRVMSLMMFSSVGLLPISNMITGAAVSQSLAGMFLVAGLGMAGIVALAAFRRDLRLMGYGEE